MKRAILLKFVNGLYRIRIIDPKYPGLSTLTDSPEMKYQEARKIVSSFNRRIKEIKNNENLFN